MTKVYGITDTNFFNFIKKLNEFSGKYNVFATQTHLDKEGFYAIIYYEDGLLEAEKPRERRSDTKATQKQLNYLRRLGYKGNQKITSREASKLIEELSKKLKGGVKKR